jgi:hypothetical protein
MLWLPQAFGGFITYLRDISRLLSRLHRQIHVRRLTLHFHFWQLLYLMVVMLVVCAPKHLLVWLIVCMMCLCKPKNPPQPPKPKPQPPKPPKPPPHANVRYSGTAYTIVDRPAAAINAATTVVVRFIFLKTEITFLGLFLLTCERIYIRIL